MATSIEQRDTRSDSPQVNASSRPVIVIERDRGVGPFGILLRLFAALALLLLIALLAVLVLLASSLAGVGQVGDNLGGRAQGALGSLSSALTRAQQTVTDRFDPSHPPREVLPYDTEFVDFAREPVGSVVGQTETQALSLVDVRPRSAAANANEAEYAVLESALLGPRETRILGLTVFRDEGRQIFYVYKGESFRLGDAYYKVNWVSETPPEIALGRYRAPYPETALKFQLD
jgi:hypothetical protein